MIYDDDDDDDDEEEEEEEEEEEKWPGVNVMLYLQTISWHLLTVLLCILDLPAELIAWWN